MPTKHTAYGCEFKCGRRRLASKQKITRHEKHCLKNPDRVPWDGEITSFKQTGKMRDYGYHDCINGSWYEWVDFDVMPDWWPGQGKIYIKGEWHDVPGYKCEVITGAHGCAGGAGCEDIWPKNMPSRTFERVSWWEHTKDTKPKQTGDIPF